MKARPAWGGGCVKHRLRRREGKNLFMKRRLRLSGNEASRVMFPAWTPAQEALLGTAPDSAVAAKLERTKWALVAHRLKLVIAPFGKPAIA
jgi:hypothetical protein